MINRGVRIKGGACFGKRDRFSIRLPLTTQNPSESKTASHARIELFFCADFAYFPRRMVSESARRHVFISHHHNDDAAVDKMTRLLERHGADTRNSSIRAKPANQERLDRGLVKDAVIRRLLRMKISWAGATVVIIGKDTHARPWVNWEIQEAERQGKRIVGVWEEGGKENEIPSSLKAYADAIVGWQADQILGAIDGDINNWKKADGTAFPPRLIKRIVCQ